jgi:anti-anti-sigma regulatory factor/anti-sigma regulatory factor (Ser/Thr protein kinase)
MQIERTWRDGCVVVALTGQLNLFTAPQVQRQLRKELGEQPLAVICDLAGVDVVDPVCANLFSTVANHPSSHWPGSTFLLCGARPAVAEILGRLRVPQFVRLCRDVDEALDRAFARPPYLVEQLRLAPTPTAPSAARRFVRDVCDYWQPALPGEDVADQAVLLAGELVANAVTHARTEIDLRVELRGELLHISVHDGSPRLLHLVPAGRAGKGGHGLRLVEEVAKAWGVNHHQDGGKVVWCTLDV